MCLALCRYTVGAQEALVLYSRGPIIPIFYVVKANKIFTVPTGPTPVFTNWPVQ